MARHGVLVAVVVVLAALLGAVAAQTEASYAGYPTPSPHGSPPAPSPPSSAPPAPSPATQTPPPPAGPALRVGFYKNSCPRAEQIVGEVVRNATTRNPGVGAGIIRMLFHDCFVRGCDASVLLDPTPANPQPEKLAPPNFPSLRGFEVIDEAKQRLEEVCPGEVSCADVVAFAARDASYFLSGGRVDFRMPAGRRDGRVSLASETVDLPPPSFKLPQLVDNFRAKNLTVDDLVVLSGAHTIGRSHCSSFSDRLSSSPGSDMNPVLAASLRRRCPANATSDATVAQDVVTPNKMDSQYYRNVLNRKVLFC
ncbi:hypothetical protein ACP70R_050355 [Stipagrostis hirtigluma subsp. patula]